MAKGKAVHKGQELNYKQKIETKTDLPLGDISDAVATEFEAQEVEWQQDENKGKIKDEAINLARLYHQEIAPAIQPEYVEEEVNFVIPKTGIKIKGFIDVVEAGGVIRDTKTTSKTPGQDMADKSLQLSAYSLAYRTLTGTEEKELVLDYLINSKQPKILILRTIRTKQDLNRFVAIVTEVSKAIEKDIYYPNPDNYMCNSENCGYWNQCIKKFGGKK